MSPAIDVSGLSRLKKYYRNMVNEPKSSRTRDAGSWAICVLLFRSRYSTQGVSYYFG
jgi:hypothetical protein